MTTITIVQGAHADYPLQAWNRGAQSAPSDWASGDTLSAYVYQGQSQAALVTLAAPSWYTAGNTQTGYGQAQFVVSVTAAQSSGLEANGQYTLLVFRTPAAGGDPECVWRGILKVDPAAGTATQGICYCTLADMLRYAPWLKLIQDFDSDQEGYYSQRYEAREWLDWLIVRSWRGTSAAYFGDAGRSAQFWLGSWVRRTPLPSYWLLGQLAGGFLLNSGITITAAGTGYTSIPTVTAPTPPAGTGNTAATLTATLNGSGGIGSIYVNTQGQGYTPGSTYSLTISGGGGTGATATATASKGVLLVRPQIVRVTARWAASLVGLAQLGSNNLQAHYGAALRDEAEAEALTIVAECDLNGDGIADLPIPINPTNTMFT